MSDISRKQQTILELLNDKSLIELLIGGSAGGASVYGQEVKTPDGFKYIENIEIGDNILDSNGGVAKVIDILYDGEIESYEITLSDGAKTRVSENHLWLVGVGKKSKTPQYGKLEVVKTQDLIELKKKHRLFIPLNKAVDFTGSKEMEIPDNHIFEDGIPDSYKFSTVKTRQNLLLAFDKNEWEIKNSKLADDLVFIIRSVGLSGRKERVSGGYKVCYSDTWHYIKNIKKIGKKHARCITTSALNDLYLTNDFIVTHNSKTFSMCLAVALMAKKYPGAKFFIGRKTLKSLRQSTITTLITKVHPFLGISPEEAHVHWQTSEIEYANGSLIMFGELDYLPSDPDYARLGSLEIDWAFIDEAGEITLEAKNAIKSRVGRGILSSKYGIPGKVIISANPSQNFLRQEYYDPYIKLGGGGFQKWEIGQIDIDGKPEKAYRGFLRMSAYDNPFLPKSYIDNLATLPDRERKRLLDGNWNYTEDENSLFRLGLLDKAITYEMPPHSEKFSKYIGCLPAGEKINTTNGLKNIEDVNLDDVLFSSNGKPTKIINKQIYDVENEPLYTLKVSNIIDTVAFTGEHPVLACSIKHKQYWKKDGKLKYGEYYPYYDLNFKKVSELKEGEFVKIPILYKNTKEMPNFNNITNMKLHGNTKNFLDIGSLIKDDETWWVIGLWLGDGHITNNTQIGISFNIHEKETIRRYEKYLELNNISYSKINKKCNCIDIMISSKQIYTFLKDNFGENCYTKNIPEWAKYISEEKKYNLVSGFVDSDGCVVDVNGYKYIKITNVSKKLMNDIQDILFSIGIINYLHILRKEKHSNIFNKVYKTATAYDLGISNDYLYDFAQKCTSIKVAHAKITKNKRRNRKRDIFFEDGYLLAKIKKITKSEITGKVYNFETDTHTFLANRIATHNCDISDKGKDSTIFSLIDNGVLVSQKKSSVQMNWETESEQPISRLMADELIEFAQRNGFTQREAKHIAVECNGVGVGIRDMLKDRGWHITEYTATHKSRSEGFYQLMLDMDSGDIKILHNLVNLDELRQQLSVHTYEMNNQEPSVIKKDKIKQSLGHSPDEADSFMIANYVKNLIANPQNDPHTNINRLGF